MLFSITKGNQAKIPEPYHFFNEKMAVGVESRKACPTTQFI